MYEGKAAEGGLEGVWNKLLSLFNKGKDEVVRSSKVSKARLDLSSLKRERERVFERLGEEIYRRHKEKGASFSGLDPFFTEIDIINLKLSSRERELKGLSGEVAPVIPATTDARQEGRERPYRPRRRPTEVKQEIVSESSSLMGL